MDEETVRKFKAAVAEAQWNLSFAAFCRKLGWTPDNYAKQKFEALQDASRALGQFDAKTLTKLIAEE